MSSKGLRFLSGRLFEHLNGSGPKPNTAWDTFSADVLGLAQCMSNYATMLETQNEVIK